MDRKTIPGIVGLEVGSDSRISRQDFSHTVLIRLSEGLETDLCNLCEVLEKKFREISW